MIKHTENLFYRPFPDFTVARLPKQPYKAAVKKLLAAKPDAEVDFDYHGYVRTVAVPAASNLATFAFKGIFAAHAMQLIAKNGLFYNALGLGLQNVQLRQGLPDVQVLPGRRLRVRFHQVLKVRDGRRSRTLPVRGGFIVVYMEANGRIYQVNSTIRHGSNPRNLKNIIPNQKAIQIAQAKHGAKKCLHSSCRLVLSAYNGRFDPIYEVLLSSHEPQRKVWQYLVKATTGQIVYGVNKLYHADIATSTLLRIPKPTTIKADVREHLVKELPNSRYLRNERFDMLVEKNGKWRTVEAAPDGSFNFLPDSAEFEAVCCFIAMNDEDMFAEFCLGHKAGRVIPVYVRDTSVEDNAYFDPEGWEIHMGVGSGLKSGGLFVHVGLDTGVEEHENYHRRVYLETVDHDLGGSEGAATHEAVGDYGDLLSEYRRTYLYGYLYKTKLTRELIESDPRIIGLLAMYPDGIRKQRNQKTTTDKNGEPHNDGEIVGGGMTDVMEVLLTDKNVALDQGLRNACAILNVALQHAPPHKVMFRDMLRAFVTADSLLFKGKYREAIEDCFSDHGINLTDKLSDPEALVRHVAAFADLDKTMSPKVLT